MKKQYREIRLILGDQLNAQHSWFKEKNADCLYLIAELHQEMDYVKHHIQKVCAFFAAMGNFAKALSKAGHDCLYLTLDETHQYTKLDQLIRHLVEKYQVEVFSYQLPDEYRLREQLSSLCIKNLEVKAYSTEHFFLEDSELVNYFKIDEHNRMETFYRKMRKRFSILMEGSEPRGGQWNYDQKNRNKLKKDDLEEIPEPLVFANDVVDIIARLKKHSIKTFGREDESLLWPTDRKQARELLQHFCQYCLPCFGEFQDAMTVKTEHKWSLYHSRLSFALNAKILSPHEVLKEALAAFESNDQIDLAQIEGFVRQILGWREFVRGIYWTHQEYGQKNYFNAKRELPKYFWTGKTNMRCMSEAITQSLDYAYAHHIQRLMITGNFCMLTEICPDEVDEWYLGIYIDAIEWVEMPNTRGMSQFADGGIIATKPYAASANYVHKMSDYCSDCQYSYKEKTSENACPLNSLYWRFIDKNKDKLHKNHRMGMIYNVWDKKDTEEKEQILNKAAGVLRNIENL